MSTTLLESPEASAAALSRRQRSVSVRRACSQGWDIRIDDGQVIRVVRCTDWHRVERRLSLIDLNASAVPPTDG